MTQYRVINVKTGELIGFIVGKTPDRELVVQTKNNRTKVISIDGKNATKYRVDAVTYSAK